jgi:hypothetical protein
MRSRGSGRRGSILLEWEHKGNKKLQRCTTSGLFFFAHQRLIASQLDPRLFFAQSSNVLKKRARRNGSNVGSEEPQRGSLAGLERYLSP